MDKTTLAADVIIFYGPPHCGKTLYYKQNLRNTHIRVCPIAELQREPEMTLRQLILTKIISPLKEGNKVVIDDENATFTKRDSFICLIKKKASGCTIVCLSFRPQHGQTQLFWSHEFSLASSINSKEEENDNFQDTRESIEKWTADKDSLDPPRMTEGYEIIKEITSPFQVELQYKLEVPCMLIQWEGAVRWMNDTERFVPAPGVIETLSVWADLHRVCQVVLIADHTAFNTGTLSERDRSIKDVLSSITKLLSCPVYALYVRDQSRSGDFSIPPSPGLIAFLQRLLHLQLTQKGSVYVYHTTAHMRMAEAAGIKHIKASRLFKHPTLGSVYVYHTTAHMRMAEAAGIKHIKASRLFKHPTLAKSSHAYSTVSIPILLKELKVVPADYALTTASMLPLASPLAAASDHVQNTTPYINQRDIGCGRMLYLCAQSWTVLERFSKLYADYATPADSKESRFILLHKQSSEEKTSDPPSHDWSSRNSDVSHSRTSQGHDTTILRTQRDLPKWMRPKEHLKRDYKPKLKSMLSTTTYIMTPEELLATARLLLAEDGEGEAPQINEDIKDTTSQPSGTKRPDTPKKSPHSESPTPDQKLSTPKKGYRVKNSQLKTQSKAQQVSPKTNPSTSRYILDGLFDDAEYGERPRAPPSSYTQRHGKGRQSRIDEYLSPSKQKRRDLTSERSKTANVSMAIKQEKDTEQSASTRLSAKPPSKPSSGIIKKQYLVPETALVDQEEDSIVLVADTQEDSLEVSDSMSQDDSLVVYDSDKEDPQKHQYNRQRRKSSTSYAGYHCKRQAYKGGYHSVTTVPETGMSAPNRKPSLSKERSYSILDGLI